MCKQCENCYFGDKCYSEEPCPNYSPILTDIQTVISNRQKEFYKEWMEYIYPDNSKDFL